MNKTKMTAKEKCTNQTMQRNTHWVQFTFPNDNSLMKYSANELNDAARTTSTTVHTQFHLFHLSCVNRVHTQTHIRTRTRTKAQNSIPIRVNDGGRFRAHNSCRIQSYRRLIHYDLNGKRNQIISNIRLVFSVMNIPRCITLCTWNLWWTDNMDNFTFVSSSRSIARSIFVCFQ